jgi:hypothetical protein
MPIEKKRGCGFRKIGGLYLVGGYISTPCDRLPIPVGHCPVCGQGIKLSRGMTEIDPFQLWGMHEECKDEIRPCFCCDPKSELAYIMTVGAKYYTCDSFIAEAKKMGISKHIAAVPKKLKFGETVVYLAHPQAIINMISCSEEEAIGILLEYHGNKNQPRLVNADKIEYKPGIFCAFIPQQIEKLVRQKDYTPENIEAHEKRGITLIPVAKKDEKRHL